MSAVVPVPLTVAGTAVHCAQAGPADAREAVLFVHGNPGTADDWTALAAALGDHGRAVALDLPDFGRTDAPAGFPHTVEAYAGFLDEARRALGIDRVHLVLHDFGGPFGLAWARDHVADLASVTLIDTGILPGYRWHALARVWRTPVLGELFQALTTRRGFRAAIGRREPRGLPPAFVERMAAHYDRRTKRAVLRLYRATDVPDVPPEELAALAALDIPALVLWGAGDRYLPVAYAERQRAAFPSAEVHVLADSGHWPHGDAPAAVEQRMVAFLGPRLK
ncbi:alpha/beta fold hydrolase [Patulibacter defluvii]|uniref:alpha/beta fold hydrolase n=1 Tax=Patulibacter defluvii TaxID=3095358 RepID=UPI002A747878|nr:alpha/beta fold hydrolase [Patulibacter sp. DM4]